MQWFINIQSGSVNTMLLVSAVWCRVSEHDRVSQELGAGGTWHYQVFSLVDTDDTW